MMTSFALPEGLPEINLYQVHGAFLTHWDQSIVFAYHLHFHVPAYNSTLGRGGHDIFGPLRVLLDAVAIIVTAAIML